MIIDFKNENCTECDIHIRSINALKDLAVYELNNNGTTDMLLIIARRIEEEAAAIIDTLGRTDGK